MTKIITKIIDIIIILACLELTGLLTIVEIVNTYGNIESIVDIFTSLIPLSILAIYYIFKIKRKNTIINIIKGVLISLLTIMILFFGYSIITEMLRSTVYYFDWEYTVFIALIPYVSIRTIIFIIQNKITNNHRLLIFISFLIIELSMFTDFVNWEYQMIVIDVLAINILISTYAKEEKPKKLKK